MGYHRAGFDVVGIDIVPQPHYPFEFFQADAMAMVQDRLTGCWHEQYSKSALPGMLNACLGHFDAIHASPPCQGYSAAQRHLVTKEYPKLLEEVRTMLRATGLPYVIENVPGAPFPHCITLCGSMFGLPIRRHRHFEVNPWMLVATHHCPPPEFVVGPGGKRPSGLRTYRLTGKVVKDKRATADEARMAMGIDWMNRSELSEAIPPAYTEHVGRHLISCLSDPQPSATPDEAPTSTVGPDASG